jgi:hypothetical protein
MLSAKATDTSLARKHLLVSLIQQACDKEPESVSVWVGAIAVRDHALLHDIHGVWRAMEKIKQELQPDFEYYMMKGGIVITQQDLTAADSRHPMYAIKVVLEDKAALATYLEKIKQELNKEEELQYQFALTDTGANTAELSLIGSKKKHHSMEKSGRRYALLHCLAEKKSPVKTESLATLLDISVDDVRGTVEEIRTVVEKKFGLPRDSIIQNDRTGLGYAASKVELKTATRHTS